MSLDNNEKLKNEKIAAELFRLRIFNHEICLQNFYRMVIKRCGSDYKKSKLKKLFEIILFLDD